MATKLELNSGNFFFAQQLLMLLVVFLFQLKKKRSNIGFRFILKSYGNHMEGNQFDSGSKQQWELDKL